MRYIVGVKVFDSNVDFTHLAAVRSLELKSDIEYAVSSKESITVIYIKYTK